MNDKQKSIRHNMLKLSIPELAELVETSINDLELKLLREINDMGITVEDFAYKVGRFKSHIYSWKSGKQTAAISKIIEMGKRYK